MNRVVRVTCLPSLRSAEVVTTYDVPGSSRSVARQLAPSAETSPVSAPVAGGRLHGADGAAGGGERELRVDGDVGGAALDVGGEAQGRGRAEALGDSEGSPAMAAAPGDVVGVARGQCEPGEDQGRGRRQWAQASVGHAGTPP